MEHQLHGHETSRARPSSLRTAYVYSLNPTAARTSNRADSIVPDLSSLGRTNANSGNRSYVLSSLKNKSKLSHLRSKERSADSPEWSNESSGGSKATVQGGNRDEDAASENSRRAIMMRRDVDIIHE